MAITVIINMKKIQKTEKYFYKKVLPIPIYKGKLVIIFSNNLKKISETVPRFKEEELYAHALYRNWKGTEGFIIVLNFHNPSRKITHGVIAHEALHVVNFLAQSRGIEADFTNDEPLTYLLEWTVDEIYKYMKQKRLNAHVL